jgi:hypothetical protein
MVAAFLRTKIRGDISVVQSALRVFRYTIYQSETKQYSVHSPVPVIADKFLIDLFQCHDETDLVLGVRE